MSGLDRLVVLEEILLRKVWFYDWEQGVRLTKISIHVDPTGYFMVIKAISAEGPVVGFKGASSIKKLGDILRDPNGRSAIQFRPDQFALDDLEKKR